MADVTYYVALPFLQDDTGAPVAGAAEARVLRKSATVRRLRCGARKCWPGPPAASARSPSAAPVIR